MKQIKAVEINDNVTISKDDYDYLVQCQKELHEITSQFQDAVDMLSTKEIELDEIKTLMQDIAALALVCVTKEV